MQLLSLGRKIDYLRLSITDKCNLRCRYCMPEEGVKFKSHEAILRVEEMKRVLTIFSALGINKLRITGGEPLVSKNLLPLLKEIEDIKFSDISLTTNGQLLRDKAQKIKASGVKRVNISLDSLKQERFSWITRGGNLSRTLDGIDAALDAGLNPVKVNTVVVREYNFDEVVDLALLAKDKPIHVRFIELMPIGADSLWSQSAFVPAEDIFKKLTVLGKLYPYKITGNGPAEVYTIKDFAGTVGFITAISKHFCNQCNRLRLTSDGKLYPCLHNDHYVDLFPALRQNANDEEIITLILKAVEIKPPCHDLGSQKRNMSSIGG